jgi:V8-like Glu-specific endopeptidase
MVLILIILVLFTCPAFSEPAIEGRVRKADITTPDFTSPLAGTVMWRETVTESGTEYLRLHFSNIVDHSSEDYTVVMTRYDGKKIKYPKALFSAKADFWTGLIWGDRVVIEVVAAKPPTGLKFVLKEYSFQLEGGKVLSIFEEDDREPVERYRDDPNIWAAAKAVCKLSLILERGLPASCTGFMIADDLLLTNEHCINTQELCDNAIAIFGYEKTRTGLANVKEHRCLQLIKKNAALDYALVKIEGNPGSQDKEGHLKLVARDVAQGEAIYMLQHPGGETKQISKNGCEVYTPRAQGLDQGAMTDFGHRCDTLEGSSGSPILDASHCVVGLHHRPFSTGAWSNVNRAVQMKLILPDLPQAVQEYLVR